jgi:hypothetical protein
MFPWPGRGTSAEPEKLASAFYFGPPL